MYYTKYRFKFIAANGDLYQIEVQKDNYSGDVIERALGRPPILKRERNGRVCGTSLEFHPECKVDGEFAEFYTSNPTLFLVRLYVMDAGTEGDEYDGLLFEGFISPELYAEPDIAPPYDVSVIATDGLGELRRYQYAAQGMQTLKYILEGLFEKTGLSKYFKSNNRTLSAGGSYTVPGAKFFDEAKVDLDFMAGKSCYDVLAAILDTIHADCFNYKGSWVLLRETEVESGANIVIGASQNGSTLDDTRPATVFGSMQNNSIWPVSESDILASKNDGGGQRMNKNLILTGWSKNSATYDTNLGAYKITSQNGDIRQNVSFASTLYRSLKLSVAVRQYRQSPSSTSAAGTVDVTVIRSVLHSGSWYDFCLAKNSLGEYYWTSSANALTFDLPAPNYGDTEENCVTLEMDLPIYRYGAAGADQINIIITRNSSNIPLLVHSAYLKIANEIAGYQDVFVIDNGAREDADDVESILIPSGPGFYNTPAEFVYNNILGSGNAPVDIFSQVGADYAKSCAMARQRKKGVLNIPAGNPTTLFPPIVFRDSDGNNYIPQSWDWDLYNCEMTVEMLSLPAASVTISEQQVTEIVYRGGTSASSGSSGGSGGGGGGSGVSSVGLSMPSGFVVSGSPVTGSGTIQVTMGEGYVIPTQTEMAKAHSHSNKSTLDGITSQKVSNWDAAAAAAHSHSNKSTLDGITSQKVSDWDAAATAAHTHTNKSILDAITLNDVAFLRKKMQALILVPPTVKRFRLQANTTSPGQAQPCFFVSHPLIAIENLSAEVCLMVYRKRNGGSGTRKTHRKGWFLACGNGHAAAAAYTAYIAPETGLISHLLPEADLLDGIAKTYLQIRNNAIPFSSYADWLTAVANVSAYGDFGFAGWYQAENLKKKIHFGLAIRIENPAFQTYVDPDPGIELLPDTGSIQGVPRYLYSAVAPLTARMYDRNTSGQQKGGVVFELL